MLCQKNNRGTPENEAVARCKPSIVKFRGGVLYIYLKTQNIITLQKNFIPTPWFQKSFYPHHIVISNVITPFQLETLKHYQCEKREDLTYPPNCGTLRSSRGFYALRLLNPPTTRQLPSYNVQRRTT